MNRIVSTKKNKIDRLIVLKVLKVMKVTPLNWWYSLYDNKKYNTTQRELFNLIAGLKKQGFIDFKTTFADTKQVFLTSKGMDKVFKEFATTYSFRTKGNMHVTFGLNEYHQFMVFKILLDYFFNKGAATKIVSFKDRSRVEHTKYGERTVYITPDLVIYEENEIANLFEADSGHEGSEQIYQKILKYFYIAINNKFESDFKMINVYFFLQKASRAMNLFKLGINEKEVKEKNSALVIRKFEQFSNNLRISDNYNIPINTDQVIEALREGKIRFFVGLEEDSWGKYLEIDFLSLFKEVNNWNL